MIIAVIGLSFSQSNENIDIKRSTNKTITASENNSISEIKSSDLVVRSKAPSKSRLRNKYRIRRCCATDHHGSHKDLISEYRKERLNRSFIRMIKNE